MGALNKASTKVKGNWDAIANVGAISANNEIESASKSPTPCSALVNDVITVEEARP